MSRRNRRGNYRHDLRELGANFGADWRDEQANAPVVGEIADDKPSDSCLTLRIEAEALRSDLMAAEAQVVTLTEGNRARWATSRVIAWMITTATIFCAIGYVLRVVTE